MSRGIAVLLESEPGLRSIAHDCLQRHLSGDSGDTGEEDILANMRAIVDGTRIFSAFDTTAGRIWIITEADRSATTLLLPEEY